VLKGLGPQAVVSSICPVQITDPAALDYGYRPAMSSVIAKLTGS
jgi:hypothetical protein